MTFGSNGADAVPKSACAAMTTVFGKDSKLTVSTNTVDHDTFQKGISNYLQGTPDDVFTWFAGYRMQPFFDNGDLHPYDKGMRAMADAVDLTALDCDRRGG